MKSDIKNILEAVKAGDISVDEALLRIKTEPYEDIGFAKVDLHRKVRQGASEVIYGAGKTAGQMIGIIDTMKKNGQPRIIITRLSKENAGAIGKVHELDYR
ncbi:MAG: 1-(5-phosphoribosyl)-5-amino-4-imidazole-carboxylate carboxylase, partial [Clostridia bacterium]|nr:1-(5-phosphoribosyl)-5-amino-4-imidazole-carboxylate carboxylase [Clostridia bacterium]